MAEVRDDLLTQEHSARMATMMQLAEQAISTVTPEITRNLYHHSVGLLGACLAGEDILHA